VIAVDTNLLVYAHRRDSEWHKAARARMTELAEGRAPWCIAWPSVHEFLAIVTHPRIYRPPSTLTQACDQVDAWLESPSLVLLHESGEHWPTLKPLLVSGKIDGARVHDARIAALCLAHGVSELWSVDRDFSRFPSLRTRNPLAD
jgi:toxin-antitoxin system PIN domain toxin